jgi:hypothetical protein
VNSLAKIQAGESSLQETDLAYRPIIPLLVSHTFTRTPQFFLVLESFFLEVFLGKIPEMKSPGFEKSRKSKPRTFFGDIFPEKNF